jgi:hypothetical protein
VPPTVVISGLFGHLPCDESAYITAALRRLPFPGRQVTAPDRGIGVEEMLDDVRRHDVPLLNRQRPLCDAFVAQARATGVRVLMTGLGGDELATDYGYYTDLLWTGRLGSFVRGARRASRAENLPLWQVLLELLRESCPQAWKRPYRWLRRRFAGSARRPIPHWITPEAARLATELGRHDPAARRPFRSKSAEFAWQALTDPYASWSNRWWFTEFGAAGIRLACPLLDRRLFEFVLGVPARLRPRCDGLSRFKLFISRGLRRYLPEVMHGRDGKVFFEAYNNRVFDHSFVGLSEYLFAQREWHSEPYVHRARACGLFESYRDGRRHASEDLDARTQQIESLWRIAGLELWLRVQESKPRHAPSPEEALHGQHC